MFASISLTTYNRTELSEYCINSILKQTPRNEFELIVVDNSSENDTVKMLNKYKNHFDKLVLNHKNNLGSAINDAWKLASSEAEWLIVLDNDDFCMKGWFENFKLLVNSELKPDVVYCEMRIPDFADHKIKKTINNGVYYQKHKANCFGAGLAIKKSIVDLHHLKFHVIKHRPLGSSIYSIFGIELDKLGLKIIHLGKPCALTQDGQHANPKYADYYKKVFSYKGRLGGRLAYSAVPKYESLRLCGGFVDNPDEYYEGSGYKIGKYYRDALNSKEGKAEWNRLKKVNRKKIKRKKIKRK